MKTDTKIPVLVIAHTFPPISGPGVFRSLNFVKNLIKEGFRPVVLTISEKDIQANGYQTDPHLLQILPEEISIHRVNTGEPRRLIKTLQRLRIFRFFWFIAYPLFWEKSAFWPFKSLRVAYRLIHEEQIPLIYTSSGPFSAVLLGYLIKRKNNIKWVVDIRDPFTDGYMWRWPSKLHWYLSRRLERFFYSKADRVIVNTPQVARLYQQRRLVREDKLITITNGF